MANRPVDINLTNSNSTSQNEETLEQYAARMIQVLDRAHIIDRFQVKDAPGHLHYEWHKDDPVTHARLTAKGFVPNDELAKTSGFVHTDGAGNPRIADVRLYTLPKEKYQILQKIEEERVRRAQDPRRADQDFMSAIKNEGGFSEVVGNSTVEEVKGLQVSLTPNNKG